MMDHLAQPLLVAEEAPLTVHRGSWLMPLLARIGIESATEASLVLWLTMQSFLANSVFVMGRNLGPVLFMHFCGAEQLTGALFISGFAIIFVSPVYGRLSKGSLAAHVNLWFTLFSTAVLLALTAPMLIPNDVARGVRPYAAYVMYIAQDILTLLLMMQSASLSQATLNAYAAKRLPEEAGSVHGEEDIAR